MSSINLFNDSIKCAHCNEYLEISGKNPNLLNGFMDQDTNEYSCWKCKYLHYRKKQQNTYSEMPVMITNNFKATVNKKP